MEMTIDEAIKELESTKDYPASDEALDIAVDIMRKHQKIEQIIEDWTKTEELEWKIREVLEDGENNN